MTRNDTFYKILFAIEIALLPLTMAFSLLLDPWVAGLCVAGIIVTKIWMELFKDKENMVHSIVGSISSALTVSSLAIFFTIQGIVESVVLCVFAVIFVVLANVLKATLFKSSMPEMINAVDACVSLFEYFILIALVVILFYVSEATILLLEVGIFAILLTTLVSVAYKTFYIIKTYDVWNKTKLFFAKMFRRK